MAMTNVEFFNLASKIVSHEFDGSPDKLQTFLDALTLLNENSNNHAANAVAFVKTRLTGKARSIITTEASLTDIINTLKNKIKGESSQLLTAKLLNHRQNHKDAVSYAAEIESLAEKLKISFTSEGVPYEVAGRYATEHVVRSLSQHSNSERARVVMEAGNFNTVQEVITKFVNVNSIQQTSTSNVLYARHNNQNYRYNRGRGQNYNNSRWRNNSGRRGFRHSRYNGSNGNNGFRQNNFQNNFQNNSPRAVRTAEINSETGNESGPQRARLGEEM